ncbi:MAG: phosphotransferase [Candidatus Liptonbacteria bacterium]|nr:phosphotransferase [Candidatus Liptonbacteria bacterium]
MSEKEILSAAEELLHVKADSAKALPTNGPDRHWNFRVRGGRKSYLVRVENPVAVAQRGTRLDEEAEIVKFFSHYGLAPRLLASGIYKGRRVIVEEWIYGRRLPKRLTRGHLKKVIAFLARVNDVPYTSGKRLVKWKEDFLDVRARRIVLEKRLREGRGVREFRPLVKKLAPILEEGAEALRAKIERFPKTLLKKPVFCYRDVTSSNILDTGSRVVAVDWERHSVGISDPSFSLVVLMRRYRLGAREREFVFSEYRRCRRAPRLREFLEVRNLERILGEATWGLSWVTRRKKLHLPVRKREIAGTIVQIEKNIRELRGVLKG